MGKSNQICYTCFALNPFANGFFMLEKNAYYHAFNLLPECGPATIKQLLAKTQQNIAKAWLYFPELTHKPSLIKYWRQIHIEQEWESLQFLKIQAISPEQQEYPMLLKALDTAPPLLYVRGRLDLPTPSLTVVGTRSMTWYGQKVVRHLIAPLAKQGVGIISGLAFGIDAEAHEVCLEQGGYTVAVLGSGLQCITPPAHIRLAERIISSGGAVISQFPPFAHAAKSTFPQRNRTMAAMTGVTLVVEAAQDSGALITARQALTFNREVGVVPGSIFSPTSSGCLEYLKKGAALVRNVYDVLDLLNSPLSFLPVTQVAQELSSDETNVYSQLADTPRDLSNLISLINFAPPKLLEILTALELKGLVKRLPGQGYVRLY